MLCERDQHDRVANLDPLLGRPRLRLPRNAQPWVGIADFKWEASYRCHREDEVACGTARLRGNSTMCQNHCALPPCPGGASKGLHPGHPQGQVMSSDLIKHTTDASFDSDVLKADKPVLVDYWAE